MFSLFGTNFDNGWSQLLKLDKGVPFDNVLNHMVFLSSKLSLCEEIISGFEFSAREN